MIMASVNELLLILDLAMTSTTPTNPKYANIHTKNNRPQIMFSSGPKNLLDEPANMRFEQDAGSYATGRYDAFSRFC